MTKAEVDAVQKVIEAIVAFGGKGPLHVGGLWDIKDQD